MRVALWNILADGLSAGEFLTKNGVDDIDWTQRRDRIVSSISKFDVDLIATIENDHPHWILNRLGAPWKAIIVFKTQNGTLKHTVCRKSRPLDPNVTFQTEYATELASLYGCSETDPYRCDNTMTIYYRSDKYWYQGPTIQTTESNYYWTSFTEIDTNKQVTIAVAHLPSGEAQSRESLRVAELTRLLHALREQERVIILMDSNTSDHYESTYDIITVSQVIQQFKYKLVNIHESECFKLRHAFGDQRSKYGQFMFDAIDKILILNNMNGTQVVPNSFLTAKQRELAHIIRTTPTYRMIIKDHCIQKWGTTVDSIDFEELWTQLPYEITDLRGLFEHLCPNDKLPSDHPPIIAIIDL
jgi:hypothetical protein